MKRYGKTFAELHKWMDEPSGIIASKHRMYRHDPYRTPKEARTLFGEYADQACLDHILADKRASEAKGFQVARPHGKSELHPLASLFFAFIFFIMGIVTLQGTYLHSIWWLFVAIFWFFALIFFLGAVGSSTKEEPTLYHYQVEMKAQELKTLKPDDKKRNDDEINYNKNNSED